MVSGDLHCAWISSAAERLLDVRADPDGLVREEAWFGALEKIQSPGELTSDQYRAAAQPPPPAEWSASSSLRTRRTSRSGPSGWTTVWTGCAWRSPCGRTSWTARSRAG
ncbi:hypothetical protein [Nesterenkonia pannonica]|uniref:hypothetical protein n=1 Tax=Nesterenkonia pannonica TaxID=1548602 RepID=UPI002164D1DA|nr:hypothetical protein [Nesterenkonia pannonica]